MRNQARIAVKLCARRSFLYVPVTYAAPMEASRDAEADVLCFDLEDSTPLAKKPEARQIIADALKAGRPKAREVLIRVNTLDTPWGHEDLLFAAGQPIDGIVLPKVEGDGVVRQARHVMGGEARPLWAMIETPLGVLRAEQVAAERVEAFVVGGADLAETLGATHTPSRAPVWHALSQIVLVAKAYGLSAIDEVHFGAPELLEAACLQAKELGFDGKSVFSAQAIAVANKAFAPSEEEVAQARASVARGGYGGHAAHARRVLAYHKLLTGAEY
jgi:citrate lyase subunit beta/citryl-CoA lyase